MAHTPRPSRHRRAATRRALALLPVLSALTLTAALPSAAAPLGGPAGDGIGEMPEARAFDGKKPLKSVEEVTSLCGRRERYNCSFKLAPERKKEFTSAVYSVSNGAINCTNSDMTIKRTVKLDTTSSDNIGGEISGSGTIEGTAWTDNEVSGSATGEVDAQQTLQNATKGSATNENTSKSSETNHSAPKDKGPNQDSTSESTSSTSATVENTVTGTAQTTEKGTTTGAFKSLVHLALRGAFTAAFKGTWNHTWSMTNSESTEVTFTLKANDEIQFGALNSMSRVVGDLHVDGTGKLVKDIAVDGPSTTNSSTVVAQTYSNPDKCQTLRPSGATAKQPDDNGKRRSIRPRTGTGGHRLTGTYVLQKGGTWRKIG
ncbi:hypothetical protein JK361_09340 [Streptomyces sp. 5-8]|uniref:Uncharacterized protein n=1 Tax=Streptomyces musisoli TaxID=2802280 RepID=A0ABS1NXF3_9ACTN|nr:hypothetical protein [Streptomyces musisoli]MBL1104795.1 hypothetical protein [Streptomyces musisoli]